MIVALKFQASALFFVAPALAPLADIEEDAELALACSELECSVAQASAAAHSVASTIRRYMSFSLGVCVASP
jgi:hypothetical protein